MERGTLVQPIGTAVRCWQQLSTKLVGRVGLEPTTKGFPFVQLSLLRGLCLHHG